MGLVLVSGQAIGQATPGSASIKTEAAALQPWEFTVTIDSYRLPGGFTYTNPVVTADHNWLHLEARYNDESIRTGSLWVGYNFAHGDFSAGSTWEFHITPMLGGVFGRNYGIAPGCEASLTFRKKLRLRSTTNSYSTR